MRQLLDRSGETNYEVLRSNGDWGDHRLRTLVTAGMIAWLRPASVLDPACGDASIVTEANRLVPIRDITLFDISHANVDWVTAHGPSNARVAWGDVRSLPAQPVHDVLVLTEILEHVPDPVEILRGMRPWAHRLIASSPCMRPGQIDSNGEHLWQFDLDGYADMLCEAGWRTDVHTVIALQSMYDFQIWLCSG